MGSLREIGVVTPWGNGGGVPKERTDPGRDDDAAP
jgi:hypothetical protein